MTEEDVKAKLLLPYLNSLGFDISEISLENSFSIRLGKSERVTGRSDILCRRNGHNLFVIELKNDTIPIKQEDIDQGISYARLLTDNIAPFTIITNGTNTRIFDSISRKELTGTEISIQSAYWKDGYTLSTDNDLQIRYEALKNFISFSPENLRQYCENQVRDRMGPIVGDITKPYSKFIKELYVQRNDLQHDFDIFLNGNTSIFAIVGPAGVGKTSAICSLALQNLDNKFVFFYNAAIINKSPLAHISQDLNGVFSSKNDNDIILKKLNEIGQFLDKHIVIFIDAVDESIDKNISLELSEIAFAVKSLEKIKICISCKANIWKNLLTNNGNRTHLFEEVDKSHKIIDNLNCPGFLLQDFNETELTKVIPLYKKVFNFKGHISIKLLTELKNGFFLRIFSEVYSGKQIPEKINDKELLRKYLKQSLEKTQIGYEQGIRILAKIGEILVQHTYTSLEVYEDNGVNVEQLLERLNFPINESLPEDLFTRNILTRSNKDDSYNVSFYYSKIRDYVVCFHTYKLDKLNEISYDILENFYENYIGQSAIQFYIETAPSKHLTGIEQFKKYKALKYVEGYDAYLDENFKTIRSLLDPETEGEIGIILPKRVLDDDGYALYPIRSNSDGKVIFENLVWRHDDNTENLFSSKDVQTIYGSNIQIMTSNQDKVIRYNVFKELKKIIEKGGLTAYNSDIMLIEMVSTFFYFYHKKLNYSCDLQDYHLPRFNSVYPINLKELKSRLYRFKAEEYYKNQNRLTDTTKNVNELVENAIENNLSLPILDIGGDYPPFIELFKIIDILLGRGYNEINNHYLPVPDLSIAEARIFSDKNKSYDINQIRISQYSDKQAKLYITKFFEHLEICYKEFVDYFFPTFKEQFKYYNTIPHEYFFYMKDADVSKWGWFGYRESRTGKFEINIVKDAPKGVLDFKEDIGIPTFYSFSFDMLLSITQPVKTVKRLNTRKVDEYCVIRNWVYKLLKRDMRNLFDELGLRI